MHQGGLGAQNRGGGGAECVMVAGTCSLSYRLLAVERIDEKKKKHTKDSRC